MTDAGKKDVFASAPVRIVSVDDLGIGAASRYKLRADGDAKVASEQALADATGPEALLGHESPPCVRVAYKFSPGWKFIMLQPATDAVTKITGKPKTLGLWIYGDASGNAIRLRVKGAEGQTHQAGGGNISFKGWKHVTLPMDRSKGTSWGGSCSIVQLSV